MANDIDSILGNRPRCSCSCRATAPAQELHLSLALDRGPSVSLSPLDLIDRSHAFGALSFKARLELAKASREVRYAKGERIFSTTERPRKILIIAEGRAKLVGLSKDGVERILYIYGVGEIIGSRVILQESTETPFDVIAMEPVRAAAISKGDFMRIEKEYPEVLLSLSRVLLRRVDRLTSGMLAALSANAMIRLAKILVDLVDHRGGDGDGFVPLIPDLTHETLAELIGASRPHTTVLLGELDRLGGVRRHRPRGLFVHRARLENLIRKHAEDGDGRLDHVDI